MAMATACPSRSTSRRCFISSKRRRRTRAGAAPSSIRPRSIPTARTRTCWPMPLPREQSKTSPATSRSCLPTKESEVNAVAPGPVWTPLIPSTMPTEHVAHFGENYPIKRPAQPRELAPVVLVNNAAHQMSFNAPDEISDEEWERTRRCGRMPARRRPPTRGNALPYRYRSASAHMCVPRPQPGGAFRRRLHVSSR